MTSSIEPSKVGARFDVVVVIGAVDVVGAGIVVAMTDAVVVEVAAGAAQATTKTNRTRP